MAEPAVEFPLNLIQGVSYVSVFKKGEFRENQRCDSHTIFRGLNKLHLPLYEYIKDVWRSESKERLATDCVLHYGVQHLLSPSFFKDLATVNVISDKVSNHSPDEERVASRPTVER